MQPRSAIKTNCVIQWIVIPLMDSAIRPLNNWGLGHKLDFVFHVQSDSLSVQSQIAVEALKRMREI